MTQVLFLRTVLILVILLMVVAGFFVWQMKQNQDALPSYPQLTREAALSLLSESLFEECRPEGVEERYRSCGVEISQDGNQATATVTYDGFFDDSVKASQVRTVATYKDGKWNLGTVSETQQCWPGRGHQDFTTEFCL